MNLEAVPNRRPLGRSAGPQQAVVTLLGVIALSGCDLISGLSDSDPVVRYEAEDLRLVERAEEWSPVPIPYLEASVRGTNRGSDTVTVTMPSCVLDLQAYDADGTALDAPSLWELRKRRSWPGGSGFLCIDRPFHTLAPGESFVESTGEFRLADMVGDSLDVGPYRFRVAVASEVTRGASQRQRNPVVDLGQLHIPVSQFPLQLDYYPRDGFIYRVEIGTTDDEARDGLVELSVHHSAPRVNALSRDLRRDCPVQLFAFRSAEERNSVPMPRFVWRWPARLPTCDDEPMSVRLNPGGVLELTSVVPRRVFAFDDADIDDFYLVVVIEVDGRPLRFGIDPD